jgi:hypothetical protein
MQVKASIFLIFSCLFSAFPNYVLAATACPNDVTTIAQLFASNMVPDREFSVSSNTCSGGYMYSFRDVASASIACRPPSTKELLPNGTIVIGYDSSICSRGNSGGYEIQQATGGPHSVCTSSSPVPEGYIIIQQRISSSGCGTTFPTRMKIKLPDEIDYTCQDVDDIPDGYIITEKRSSSLCNFSRKKIQIPQPGNTYIVCSGSPVPPGFAITDTDDDYHQCGDSGGAGFEISPVTASEELICARDADDIPPDYVVIDFPNSGMDCGLLSRSVRIKKVTPAGTITAYPIAFTEIIPTGYVIIQRGDSGDGQWYKIKRLLLEDTWICQGSTVPDGFAIIAQESNPSICGGKSGYYRIKPISGDGPITICSSSTVPTGYVITQRPSSIPSACTLGAYVIVKPKTTSGTQTLMCNSSAHTIPEGFVVVQKDSYDACEPDFGTSGGVKITKPSNTSDTQICLGSPIPIGFVIKGAGSSTLCGSFPTGSTYTIGVADGPGPYSSCSSSGFPAAYVITSSATTGVCDGTTYTVRLPGSGQTQICSISPIPDDYVVVGKNAFGGCSGNSYTIQLPNSGGETAVCSIPSRPVPTGFINTGFGGGYFSACDGNGFIIEPFGNGGSIVPAPFVNAEQDVATDPSNIDVQCYTGTINAGLVGAAQKNTALCN